MTTSEDLADLVGNWIDAKVQQAYATGVAERATEVEQLTTQIAALEAQILELTASLESANAALANCAPEKEALEAQLAALNVQLTQLTADLAASNAANADLSTQLSEATTLVGSLQTQVSQFRVQIANLQSELAACRAGSTPPVNHRVLYGVNPGGWVGSESNEQAVGRMASAFGPIAMCRVWPNNFNTTWRGGLIPEWMWNMNIGVFVNLGSDISGINAGQYDQAFDQILASAPTDRPIAISMVHEPENDTTPGPWVQAQNRMGARKKASGRDDIMFTPLLMGATFHPTRYKWTNDKPWTDWFNGLNPDNIDVLGADCYQTGTSLASLDHAETVIQPCLDAAAILGVPLGLGEMGVKQMYNGTTEYVPDAKRAEYVNEVGVIVEANKAQVKFVLDYESSRGAKGPWNLLPKPGTQLPNSPLAIAAYRQLVLNNQ